MIGSIKKIYNPLSILNFATFMQYQRFVMPVAFLFYIYNGLNFSDFILCQSIYSATCLIGKISSSFFGDIFSKKKLIIIAYFLFFIRVFLWLNFTGFWIILSGEILYGLFNAFYKGNIDSYIYELLQKDNKTNLMANKYGRWAFYTSLGSAVSCILGAALYNYFGFKMILTLEFVTQIISISALIVLPDTKNIKIQNIEKHDFKYLYNGLKTFFINSKINYTVYYAAVLFGLTSIFVWNFQPLLKLSAAPIIIFGFTNFINQLLRGLGGLQAKTLIQKINDITMYRIQYLSVIISFILLIYSYYMKNFLLTLISIILISLAIMFFVIFRVYSITTIHNHCEDKNRAFIASTVSFTQDFSSFIFLLIFKFAYDHFDISLSILIFAIISILILYPKKRFINS